MRRLTITLATAVLLAPSVHAQPAAAPSATAAPAKPTAPDKSPAPTARQPEAGAIAGAATARPEAPAAVPAPAAKPPGQTAPVTRMPPDKVEAILGEPVVGPLGDVIGRLIDVLVDQKGQPEAAVIDFGGFMGVGSRKIAVHWNTLHFNPGDPKYPIVLDLLPEQIKAAPAYEGESKPAPVVVAPSEPHPPAANAAKTSAPQ